MGPKADTLMKTFKFSSPQVGGPWTLLEDGSEPHALEMLIQKDVWGPLLVLQCVASWYY